MVAKNSETLLSAILDSSDDAIIIETGEGNVAGWSRGAERIFGYRAEEMIGRPVSALAIPGQPLDSPEILRRAIEGARVEHYETVRRHKNGVKLNVSLTLCPIVGRDGQTEGFVKIARDITATKNAQMSIEAGEAHLRAIVEAIPDGMVIIDQYGVVRSFSDRAAGSGPRGERCIVCSAPARAHADVAQEGDPPAYVYKVTSGTLRAVKLLPDGRRHIANFLMPGDFFGLADSDVHAHGLEAVSDSTLRKYPRRGFESFLERDTQARRRLFAAMCKELSAIHKHLLLLGRKTATDRRATFLLDLAERLAGGRGGTEPGVELPMNRSDVADYLGLRIETVCRLLSELKNRRIIELIDMHRIRLLKREVLVEMSAGDCN